MSEKGLIERQAAETVQADEVERYAAKAEELAAVVDGEPLTWWTGLAALLRRVERERDEAQSACTAWQGVFQTIEAHLMDRVAMDDPAKPQTYLDIIRYDVADIDRQSKAIVATRWADAKRSAVENARLAARIEELERGKLNDAVLDAEVSLKAVRWEGRLRCVYLNGYRVAGGKPWAGGTTEREWTVPLREIVRAFPELQSALGLNRPPRALGKEAG